MPSSPFRYLWLLVCVALLGAGACRSDDTPPEPAAPTEAPMQEEPSEAVEPFLVIWSDAARAPVLEALGEEFAAAYGVEVVVEERELSAILEDFKRSLLQQTDMPDIFLGGYDWISVLAANGVIAPLNMEPYAHQFAPAALQAMAYEGFHFGVPIVVDSLALLYNPELLAAPPGSWEEVRAIAAAQVAEGHADMGLALNVSSPFDFYPVLTGFGGDLFRSDPATGPDLADVRLHSPESQQALVWLQEMIAARLVDPIWTWDDMHRAFIEQRVPMMVTGPWSLPRLAEGQAVFDIAPLPDNGRSFVNVLGYMINTYASDPFLAWIFLSNLLMTEEGMLRLYEAAPATPAFLPVLPRIADPDLAAFGQVAATQGTAVPNIVAMEEIWRIWSQAHHAAVHGTEDGMASYNQASQAIAELLRPLLEQDTVPSQ